MKTTTVALGPHFEDFIQASILSGRYNNASEVVRSGLRLLEDQEYASRLAALRYAIDEGEASGGSPQKHYFPFLTALISLL